MALIACPECGKEVADKAPTCPNCGVPIFRESKVVVVGYTQQFAIQPKVHVSWNGARIGAVKKGESISFDISTSGEVSFTCYFRSASVPVQAGRVTNIKLAWDRVTGRMIPQVVDVITAGL
jgi:hypothetical protein